ncbi:ABC transporter permease [Arthrobacter sp. GCM10027362]|uniref:ABC transporter permease n=1 Tax=Arthrobacter sp. GCM10027362 TaxID=3273379 RepID=UPI00364378BF
MVEQLTESEVEVAGGRGLPKPPWTARLRDSRAFLGRNGVFFPFVLVTLACIGFVPSFVSESNLVNVLINASIMAIIGYGMTMVIALRGLDLSVGSVQGLVACVAASLIGAGGLGMGVIGGILVGALIGIINGVLIAYLKIPSFVATLGAMGIVRGIALLVAGGGVIDGSDPILGQLTSGRILGIPVPLLVALVLLAISHTVLQYTAYGRHVCAVGGSPEAAGDSGINVRLVTLVTFAVSGLYAGIGGILLTSQLGTVNGSLGTGLELQIIAIAVLGGTSLAGGSGNLVGTFIASALLAMIASGLNLMNVPSFYQYLTVGLLLIMALSLDSAGRRIQKKRLLKVSSQ